MNERISETIFDPHYVYIWKTGDFRCDSGKCMPKYAVCNGANDCGDNSDERGCSE